MQNTATLKILKIAQGELLVNLWD